jgi:hypothetical protein
VKEKMLLIKATKCLLVVPESRLIKLLIDGGEFETAVRRGKAWRRQERFKEMLQDQKRGKNDRV